MSKPIPSFVFKANGLTVDFTDQTINDVTGYLWDFGFQIASVEQTSTLRNPTGIVFPNGGIFSVSLAATNGDGTNVFTYNIELSVTPSLNLTIAELVLIELPPGLPVNYAHYDQLIKKWQLFLQGNVKISDADVFDETKWPQLVNVLISKLVVYDLVLLAQRTLITSTSFRVPTTGGLTGQELLLTDYSISLNFSPPLNIISLLINDVEVPGPNTPITSNDEMVTWLNSLSKGVFSLDNSNNIISLGNSNLISILNYSVVGNDLQVLQVLFNQSNQRVSNNTTGSSTSSSIFNTKGPIKKIETGPSNAEWVDLSSFWANLLKSGIVLEIKQDVCMYAYKVNIRLYFCPDRKSTKVFIIGKKQKGCC